MRRGKKKKKEEEKRREERREGVFAVLVRQEGEKCEEEIKRKEGL